MATAGDGQGESESEAEVKAKLERLVYIARDKEAKKGHPLLAKCWAGGRGQGTIREIVHRTTNAEQPWVQCKICLKLFPHSNKQSPNKLNRHSSKCSQGAPASLVPAPSSSASSTPSTSTGRSVSACKKEFTQASVDFAVARNISFNALNGGEYAQVIQTTMDLARADPTLNAKDIIPDPTTVSRNVKLSADRARLEVLPEIKESIDKGEASAATDMYTEDCTKVSYLAVTVHYVKHGKKCNVTLFCKQFEGTHDAESIKAAPKDEFALLGIDPDSVHKLTFITDNGANVKLALRGYNRLHCMAHAINLVLKNSFVLKLFDLNIWGEIGVILDDVCNWFVQNGRKGHKKFALKLKKLVPPVTKRKYKSKCPLFKVLLGTFDKVKKILEAKGKDGMLRGLSKSDIKVALDFVSMLEKGSEKLKPAYIIRASAFPAFQTFCEALPEDSFHVLAYRGHIKQELAALEAVHVIEMCKRSVTWMKQSTHFSELQRKLHQEMPIRWNSHLPMLKSVDVQFKEVQGTLRANGQTHLDNVTQDQIKQLIAFLEPFNIETKRIQDETKPVFHFGEVSFTKLRGHTSPKANDVPMVERLRARSAKLLDHYWKPLPEHRLAAFLMPDFKRLTFLSPEAKQEVHELARSRPVARLEFREGFSGRPVF